MSETQTPEPPSPSCVTEDRDDPLAGELMQLNMGPSHPATHGVLRLKLTVDGEIVRHLEPVVGYLHRGKEKACESLGWRQFFVHTDRLDYLQPMMNNVGYALALETLADVEVPERGQVIRVLMMELSRIMAHLVAIGISAMDLGAVTLFFLTWEEREKIYDILDALTGHRMNHTYLRLGGVYSDVEPHVEELAAEFIEQFPRRIDEWEGLLTGNRIWHGRNKGVGVLSAENALAWGLTGPNLRGSGVEWDVRKGLPYSGYETYDFEIAVGTVGDSFDRYLVRMEEMRQSVRICVQALDRLKQTRGAEFLAEDRHYVLPPKRQVHGSMEELIHQFKIVTDMSLPAGEAYGAVESSKGELGFFIVSDGTSAPVRCHIRAPSLMTIQAIPLLAEGCLLSDVVTVGASLDFVMGEVDR